MVSLSEIPERRAPPIQDLSEERQPASSQGREVGGPGGPQIVDSTMDLCQPSQLADACRWAIEIVVFKGSRSIYIYWLKKNNKLWRRTPVYHAQFVLQQTLELPT